MYLSEYTMAITMVMAMLYSDKYIMQGYQSIMEQGHATIPITSYFSCTLANHIILNLQRTYLLIDRIYLRQGCPLQELHGPQGRPRVVQDSMLRTFNMNQKSGLLQQQKRRC